jgi:hypothetical protein
VLKTVGVMHQVRRAFEAFDDLDQDLTPFIELRVFPKCDQFECRDRATFEHGLV